MKLTASASATALIRVLGAIGQIFLLTSYAFTNVRGEVRVEKVEVIDDDNNGVESRIIERNRKGEESQIKTTDDKGILILKPKFRCPDYHEVLADPVAGSYTRSLPKQCETKMTLWVRNYPKRAIRLIVPFGVGGTTDILARAIGQKLSESLEQQVLIDNRPGASGNIGTEIVARAASDGHTLLVGTAAIFTTNPSVYVRLPYDPIKDFAPITMIVTVPNGLVVAPSLPVRSVKELIALAKSKPGQIAYASTGSGTVDHLAGELFKVRTGVNIVHIPYKGSTPAVLDMVAGQIQLSFGSLPPLLPRIKSGELRVLGVAGAKRSAILPDVPTIAEAGVPGYEVNFWYGVFAPAGTPKEIIGKLNGEIIKILRTQDIRESFLSRGAEPVGTTPGQFAAIIRTDIEKWTRVVRDSGVRVD